MPTLHESLHAALDAVVPQLGALVDALGPNATVDDLDPQATEQFLRAFVALLHEGIDGGREQRDLVMTTAVPALVHAGQSADELVETHVQFFMLLGPRLLEHVPAEQREESARWLAGYAGAYTREVLERARQVDTA